MVLCSVVVYMDRLGASLVHAGTHILLHQCVHMLCVTSESTVKHTAYCSCHIIPSEQNLQWDSDDIRKATNESES